jgi:hypothetical protein
MHLAVHREEADSEVEGRVLLRCDSMDHTTRDIQHIPLE